MRAAIVAAIRTHLLHHRIRNSIGASPQLLPSETHPCMGREAEFPIHCLQLMMNVAGH